MSLAPQTSCGFSDGASVLWFVADLPRGDHNQAEYGRSIESFVVLRRPSQCREKVFRIESIHP